MEADKNTRVRQPIFPSAGSPDILPHVPRSLRWFHISLEVVGAVSIVLGVSALILWLVFIRPMKNYPGGDCTDTEQRLLPSPDGKRTIKSFHRVCGQLYSGYSFYLSTGNPNPEYEYAPIVELKDVAPGQASATWDGPNQISVKYPATAKLGDTYAYVLGVHVVMRPDER